MQRSIVARASGLPRGDTVGQQEKQPEAATADTNVYYSTPFGDTNDGEQKLFLLERNGVRYMPVFRSVESMKEFYERMDRAAYMILQGDLTSVMATLQSIELMKGVAIVIDPLSEYPVEIMPDS